MNKILTLNQAIELSKQLQEKDKTIVLVGGCFDILHKGHLSFLEEAKKQGDVLFVALESDENVKKLKGKERPVNNQQKRAYTLADINVVDAVLLLAPMMQNAYQQLTKDISPHIIAITQGDPYYAQKKIQAESIGAQVVPVIKRLTEYSTTQILQKQ